VQLDLREYKTFEFWEDILQDVSVRQDDGYYYVDSQQPPDPQSRKYCDLIVSATSRHGKKVRLMVVEAKRLNIYRSTTQVAAMEQQLRDYCDEVARKRAPC
jgi:hypothetical protein